MGQELIRLAENVWLWSDTRIIIASNLQGDELLEFFEEN